jgi:F-type H+-transporting ATPase subunit a
MTKKSFFLILSFLALQLSIFAQHSENGNVPVPTEHASPNPEHATSENHTAEHGCFPHKEEKAGYNSAETILNHIANANEFHVFGHYSIPLPCILYSKVDGLKTMMSSVFHHGKVAVDGYVSDHGTTKRIVGDFPAGAIELTPVHEDHYVYEDSLHNTFICYQNKIYPLEKASGLLAATSFYDFSVTKNVFTMLLAGIILLLLFTTAAKGYKTRAGQAPKGVQNLLEPMVIFIRDEVAKPMIGKKYERFLPYLLTIFFFILVNNLMGLIPMPFAGMGANVTGNIATTAALALIALLVTVLNGKSDYWKHIFWMPGVPVPMKIFLAPIELLGVFTKPISLMIRLFANITAGHIIILALVGLIFVFGKAGESVAGAGAGVLVGGLFTLFLSVIELIVAFIQAFIFTILTASYIGAAVEEHHHEEAHH